MKLLNAQSRKEFLPCFGGGGADSSTVTTVQPGAPDVAVLTAAVLSSLPTVHPIYEQLETIMAMRVLSRPERSSE